tara:strand:+ start:1103 stop:2158 length:1056 start_codon:yes stop_codon:yes gene_type:complete
MKNILFIGSESYDGPTITIIEGLYNLGYKIFVYKKTNINSWFCNIIIDSLDNIEDNIDFIISNLHWGTRWDLYNKINKKIPYILIDGDDHNNNTWKNKYIKYCNSYGILNTIQIKDIETQNLLSKRIMIKIENYEPDLIFKTQKFNNEGIYLPFGINFSYLQFKKNIPISKRKIDICHFPGPGKYRENMTNIINKNFKNYSVSNKLIYGNMIVDNNIKTFCEKDNNIHSWHRWKTCDEYFNTINNSKICIYVPAPGGWDSKRPWEILSQGTILLYFKTPGLIDNEYPLKQLGNFFEFTTIEELINKCNLLLNNKDFLNEKAKECHKNAEKYFTSEPITEYFLSNISRINNS